MKITEHFTLEELCASSTAKKRGISNTPDSRATDNLRELSVYLLEPLRIYYGKPICITSGYRCPKLNEAVGGAANSSHKYGLAADIIPSDGDMKGMQAKVLEWAKTHAFDQIIMEKPKGGTASWIHVGWRRGVNNAQRRQVLKASVVSGRWIYQQVKL